MSDMDRAQSYDSVISLNSGCSEDSMEHLSAEERACLIYLEETIEALEVQEDSGLSNDEPDSMMPSGKRNQIRANDTSSLSSESETPKAQPSSESGADKKDPETSVDTTTQAELPATEPAAGNIINPLAHPTNQLCLSKDEDSNLSIVSGNSQPSQVPEVDLSLIPPPSDFMDEPQPPPEPEKAKEDPPPPAGVPNSKPRATLDLGMLRKRVSNKVSSRVAEKPPNKTPEPTQIGVSSDPHPSPPPSPPPPPPSPPPVPPPDVVEPKSPPAVAPKPKKLPANIILKTHKPAVSNGHSGHSVPTASDRLLMDPQRVRMEALRKLGLLRSDDSESGSALSPKLSPQSRRSWAAPTSPVSPAPNTPPTTPSHTRHSSPIPASIPPHSPVPVSPSVRSTPPEVQLPPIVPAPAAFGDPDGPLLSESKLSAVEDTSGATAKGRRNMPPGSPTPLIKTRTSTKDRGLRSQTLDPSSLGLNSYMSNQDFSGDAVEDASDQQSSRQLPTIHPRTTSLGGKELSGAQGEGSQVGSAANQHFGDAQKLPRSQGISVLICPRSENGDERREALKRLGLLRD